ncbi:chemotaxis protein CheD [Selenihalanaerobacter shriftii]|uniref:Probable chemoreceptor glutamine deamidase CheD n=2 Tax=Selenihalanaerobacter shriftii TaxID=142842 RepID=A0A1T4KEQ4_9FIRM|nr:chemotaxis protein CheD [Selenihalanaerobacter shriftii]
MRTKVKKIFAGDFYTTRDREEIISTLLGSCVATCLIDNVNSVYGMNHFMLPMELKRKDKDKLGKYGLDAMEILISAMLKQGANLKYLEAKLFGGGRVVKSSYSNVAKANVDFAKMYLEQQQIPIIAQDVGGTYGRQIYFYPKEGIYSRKIKSTHQELA